MFVDLEKAYDKVQRELMWCSFRKKVISELHIAITQDLYQDTQTRGKTRCDTTE